MLPLAVVNGGDEMPIALVRRVSKDIEKTEHCQPIELLPAKYVLCVFMHIVFLVIHKSHQTTDYIKHLCVRRTSATALMKANYTIMSLKL